MGAYRNPKTKAKEYKKKKYNKNIDNKRKEIKTEELVAKLPNTPKNNRKVEIIKKATRKYIKKYNNSFKPCAKTIVHFDRCKNDKALLIMFPIKFKFLSNKLTEESSKAIYKFIIKNSYIYSNISNDKKGGAILYKHIDVFKDYIIKKWTKNKYKISLNKLYNSSDNFELGFIKRNRRWYFILNIGKILQKTIEFKFSIGQLSYKFYILGLEKIKSSSIAILDKDKKINTTCISDYINCKENAIQIFWNNKESYNDICKIYYTYKTENMEDFDVEGFFNKAKLCMEYTNLVVKTLPVSKAKENRTSNRSNFKKKYDKLLKKYNDISVTFTDESTVKKDSKHSAINLMTIVSPLVKK